MGTIFDSLTSTFLAQLGDLIENEVLMILRLGKDIKSLKENLEQFRAVREDAEVQAMEEGGLRELWWNKMSGVMFDTSDVIDYFVVHSQGLLPPPRLVCCKHPMLSCFAKLPVDHRVAKRIRDINERLDEIKKSKDMFTLGETGRQQLQATVDISQTSWIDELEVVGRDISQTVHDMVQMVISSSHENRSGVWGIQGMGGIGKTTLAQEIYNEQRIRERFQVHIWLCISQSYTETGLLKQAIRMARGKCDQEQTKTELLPLLMDTIKGKSVFLVLDDVWRSDVWMDLLRSPFKRCSNAHVLVTTREVAVLEQMQVTHIHQVDRMNARDGLELLMKMSFPQYDPTSEFNDIGSEIVQKCGRLPLAIKVAAGVLSDKRTRAEWESIRDSEWSIDGLPEELGGALYVSYRKLPSHLKQCFLWCALLPPNFQIQRDAVSCWWVAEGFVRKEPNRAMHQTAERYYHELIRRNLLQPKPEFVDKGESTMHDLLRSLAQYLTKGHSLFMTLENNIAQPNLRRLGISNAVEKLPALEEHRRLRSLLLFNNKNFKSVHRDIFRKLEHIRVLILSGTGIQNIPESVGNLVLLKLLDLSFTEIKKLPESTGSLVSLEYLSLLGCLQLTCLPASLMGLSNISFLQLQETAIDNVPQGIERFEQLYNLRGVFESETGFRLNELQRLKNVQRLCVEKLEKATPPIAPVLKKSCHLRELGLSCTIGTSTHDTTVVEKIQQVYEMLIPSPNLVYIFLDGFLGTKFPEWLCSGPERNMPNLCHMHLNECISCLELPPAGQMPELLVLQIRGADAVVNIGTELLGTGVISTAAFFPKLQLLRIIDMLSLESWSLDTDKGKPQQLCLMPCLKRLLLRKCPELRALPEGLNRIVNLKRIHIEGAHKLEKVDDLPAVLWLKLKDNKCLKTISNLYNLRDLFAQDCPALDQAENLISLNRLYMVDCPHAREFRGCIEDALVHFETTIDADGRDIYPDESLYN